MVPFWRNVQRLSGYMTAQEAASNELVRYLVVPLRRWRLVALVTLLGVAATLLYVVTVTRTYTATALVDLHQISTSPFDATKSSNQLIDVATEAKTATSQVVASRASDLLSGHPPTTYLQNHVKVAAAAGTTTLSVTFTAASPAEAAGGANAFAKAYLDSRSMWADKRRKELVDSIDDSLKSLRSQLSKVNKSLAEADPASASAQDDLTSRTLLTQQFADLTQRQNALTGMSIDPGQVVSSATPGGAAVAPNRKVYLVGGLLMSVLIGFAGALVREALDRRVRRVEQMEGLIDAGVVSTDHVTRELIARQSPPNDAMYVLRSRVLSGVSPERPPVLLLVDLSDKSSAGAVGAQLAQLMANTGTLIRLVMVTDGQESIGWLGNDDWVQADSGLRTSWLPFTDPDNLNEQNALHGVLAQAQAEGAIIVLAMTGRPRRSAVVAMSTVADDVLVVAQVGNTQIAAVRQTVQDIVDSGANIFGGVLVDGRRFRRSSKKSKVGTGRSTAARPPAHGNVPSSAASAAWSLPPAPAGSGPAAPGPASSTTEEAASSGPARPGGPRVDLLPHSNPPGAGAFEAPHSLPGASPAPARPKSSTETRNSTDAARNGADARNGVEARANGFEPVSNGAPARPKGLEARPNAGAPTIPLELRLNGGRHGDAQLPGGRDGRAQAGRGRTDADG
jgi:polysaccharide biosynthesis transport protein